MQLWACVFQDLGTIGSSLVQSVRSEQIFVLIFRQSTCNVLYEMEIFEPLFIFRLHLYCCTPRKVSDLPGFPYTMISRVRGYVVFVDVRYRTQDLLERDSTIFYFRQLELQRYPLALWPLLLGWFVSRSRPNYLLCPANTCAGLRKYREVLEGCGERAFERNLYLKAYNFLVKCSRLAAYPVSLSC